LGELPSIKPARGEDPYAPLGGHEYAIAGGEGPEGGDLVHLRVHGAIELPDIKLILALLERIAELHQQAFLIVHMAGAGGFAPDARRYYVTWRKLQPKSNRWVYVIGTNILVRTLVMLVLRGTKLISGYEPSIQLVQTEGEAHSLIAEVRGRLR